MTDLDRQLQRFYTAEGGRTRVTHVGIRGAHPWREAIVAISVLLLVVGGIRLLSIAGQATRTPVTATGAASNVPVAGARVRVDDRVTIPVAGTVCRIAAAGDVLLTTTADPHDQAAGCQLMISTDAGTSWTRTNMPSAVQSVAIAPHGDLFAGLADGTVERASADTRDWKSVYRLATARSSPGIIRFAFGATDVWAGGVGVLRSADGVHWEDVTHGLGSLAADTRERPSFGVVGLVARPDGVIAAINGNIPEVGLWRFTAGSGWQRIAAASLGQPLDLVDAGGSLVLLTQRGSIAPDRTSTPAAWQSLDDGATWHAIDYGTGSGAVLRAGAAVNGGVLAAASDGLVRLDGSTWEVVPGWAPSDVDVRALSTSGSHVYAVAGDALVRYRIVASP